MISEIWDYLIEWGIAQNPTLPVNFEEWSNYDFMTLRETLQRCLPLIRYFHIPNSDVIDKVKPFKKILDKQLWKDLKQHIVLPDRPIESTILPPRINNLFSEDSTQEDNEQTTGTIINESHVAMILSWIDDQSTSYAPTNNPYEFRLLLSGNEQGFDPSTFWYTCHGHANTIVVARVEGTEEIIGGFNPLAWDKTKKGWMKTNKSFIFSFPDGTTQNSIISRVKSENRALKYFSDKDKEKYGPYFGYGEFKMKSEAFDFTHDKQNQCKNFYYYEKSIRTTNEEFSISDYKVFKIVKSVRR